MTLLKMLAMIVVMAFGVFSCTDNNPELSDKIDSQAVINYDAEDRLIEAAYNNKQSDLQVESAGVVVKILPDDEKGSRHQRFIIRLSTGQTVLIAHNIDLAPRVEKIKVGDRVNFFGEYEWNQKGGVIHWTHHDPRGKHVDGWIKYGGQHYQ